MKSQWWLVGLVACLGVACLAPLASSSPDGLERVAEDKGFAGLARQAPFKVITDYAFPGMESRVLATMLAGLLGALVVFGTVYGVAWLVKSARKEPVK